MNLEPTVKDTNSLESTGPGKDLHDSTKMMQQNYLHPFEAYRVDFVTGRWCVFVIGEFDTVYGAGPASGPLEMGLKKSVEMLN